MALYVVKINPPTEKELSDYRNYKLDQYLNSLHDKDKMEYKKPKAIGKIGKITFGLCPTCNHCISIADDYCDNCFQRLDWYNLDKI